MELDLCLLMEGFQLTIRYDQGALSVGGFELISFLPGIGVEREVMWPSGSSSSGFHCEEKSERR